MSHRPAWAPDGIDLERPAPARMYDYHLGGSHNFAADRELARTAYVDSDPVAVSHSHVLLADTPNAVIVHADLRDPARVPADPALGGFLDFTRPVAVLMFAVLHFVSDSDDPLPDPLGGDVKRYSGYGAVGRRE